MSLSLSLRLSLRLSLSVALGEEDQRRKGRAGEARGVVELGEEGEQHGDAAQTVQHVLDVACDALVGARKEGRVHGSLAGLGQAVAEWGVVQIEVLVAGLGVVG